MNKSLPDQLKARVEQLSTSLAQAALDQHAERDESAYQRLEDLQTLQAALAAEPKNDRKPDRIKQLALVATVTGLVAVLSFLPVARFKPLTIEAEIFADSASLQVATLSAGRTEAVTPLVTATGLQLAIDGAASVRGNQNLLEALRLEIGEGGAIVASAAPGSPLTLDLPAVKQGTIITVQRKGSGKRHRILFEGKHASFDYRLVLPRASKLQLESDGSTWVVESVTTAAFAAANSFDVEFEHAGARKPLFTAPLPIRWLRFSEELEGVNPFPVSSIESGTIHIGDVQRQLVLRSGQRLEIGVVRGIVRTLEPTAAGPIRLTIAAVVDKLTIDGRSELPTVLEYVSTSPHFNLVWSSLLALLGIVLTLARWTGLLKAG